MASKNGFLEESLFVDMLVGDTARLCMRTSGLAHLLRCKGGFDTLARLVSPYDLTQELKLRMGSYAI